MRPRRYVAAAAAAALTLTACALSVQEELRVGAEYAQQLDRELPIIRDAAIQSDLDRIAARLTPLSARPELRYQFRAVNSDAVNAFAVPGGYIYVTRGLIEHARSMDELAGVLGHEMGHVEYRHSAKQIGRAQLAQLGVGLAGVLAPGGRAAEVAQTATAVGGQIVLARYSRDQESEADRAAVDFSTRARVNPRGIVTFFEVLKETERSRPNAVEALFISHPLTDDRIAAASALITASPEATALQQTGEHDAPEFQRLKAAVSRLPAPPDRQPRGR
jgi:predicted Zn-dependent protease